MDYNTESSSSSSIETTSEVSESSFDGGYESSESYESTEDFEDCGLDEGSEVSESDYESSDAGEEVSEDYDGFDDCAIDETSEEASPESSAEEVDSEAADDFDDCSLEDSEENDESFEEGIESEDEVPEETEAFEEAEPVEETDAASEETEPVEDNEAFEEVEAVEDTEPVEEPAEALEEEPEEVSEAEPEETDEVVEEPEEEPEVEDEVVEEPEEEPEVEDEVVEETEEEPEVEDEVTEDTESEDDSVDESDAEEVDESAEDVEESDEDMDESDDIDESDEGDEEDYRQLMEQREENARKIQDLTEEKQKLMQESSEKFDAVMNKEKGTDEYKEALSEYNALRDRQSENDGKLTDALAEKEELDKKLSDYDQDSTKVEYDTQSADAIDDGGDASGPQKVLKRDELELLKAGDSAIKSRLEAKADDYRDQGLSEKEISDRLAVDKWNYQKEFLRDAFPGQDVSPNVFNGLSENGSKDRIAEIETNPALRDAIRDGGDPPFNDGPTNVESFKDKIAAFLNRKPEGTENTQESQEVSEKTESAQKIIDAYCKSDLDNVLSDEKKAVRLKDTVTFQDNDEFAKGYGNAARAEHINGYNNGKMSYVKNSGPHPEKTAIHEHNHQLSCNDVKDANGKVVEYRRGVSIDGRDRQVNEALTEMFTKKMMGPDYPAHPNVGYLDNMHRMEKMEPGFGTDTLKEAYYKNKPELLKEKYDAVMGDGSWEKMSKAFDDSMADYTPEEIARKREHYRKTGQMLETETDVKRREAINYANKNSVLFYLMARRR